MRSSLVGSPSAAGLPANAIAAIATAAHRIFVVFMESSSKGGDGTIFLAMKRLRRVLVVLGILTLVAYVAAAGWLVANESTLLFAGGRPLGNLRPAGPRCQCGGAGIPWLRRRRRRAERAGTGRGRPRGL